MAVKTSRQDQTDDAAKPSDFFTPPPITRDSVRIGARIDSGQAAAIKKLVESEAFEWPDQSAFLRWAVTTGITRAAQALNDEHLSNELRVLNGILRRSQVRQREKRFFDTLTTLVSDIKQMVKEGSVGDARQEYRQAVEDARGLTMSRYKERFIRDLEIAFPEFAKELETKAKKGAA